MELKKINQEFSVCKVEDFSLVNLDVEYVFIGKTDEELSLVCRTEDIPDKTIERDDGWRGSFVLTPKRSRPPRFLSFPVPRRT